MDPDGGRHEADNARTAPGAPRWVKIFGLVVAIVIAVIVVLLLFGGPHGPSRHSGLISTTATTASGG
jgi:hypothetical protein